MSDPSPPSFDRDLSEKDRAYRTRNYTAIAFASVVADLYGATAAGWRYDPTDHSGWPVVFIESERGQIGWHVPPDLEPILEDSTIPNRDPSGGYDEHSRHDRLERLWQIAVSRQL